MNCFKTLSLSTTLSLAAALIASATAWADSPFDGTWTLNTAKSHLAGDTMTLKDEGGGTLSYEDSDQTYTFKPDGTPFTTPFGVERTFKQAGDGKYEFSNKRNGSVISTGTWTVSADAKKIVIDSKGTKPNGDQFENKVTFMRTGTGTGLAGTWTSTAVKLSSPNTLTLQTEGKDDVTLTISAIKASCKAKWDGKEYPVAGPTVPDGLTLALRKTGPDSFKVVERVKTKVLAIARYKVAADDKTLTPMNGDLILASLMKACFPSAARCSWWSWDERTSFMRSRMDSSSSTISILATGPL